MKQVVALFGGAVSGAEAAAQLAERGIRVIVFDQNKLPYGKIEDGLPKWHVKLRNQEEAKIDQKLDHPLITFVPGVRLGRDLDFQDVVENWGFSAVILAIGAWRDRPLPIPGIDEYRGKGLYYQNNFIYWFNHFHEPDYAYPDCEHPDGTIVIGGGLASIDVCKALMMLNVQQRLKALGHSIPLLDFHFGIDKVLNKLGLTFEALDLKACTLYYRRRIKDMPLSPVPPSDATSLEKVESIREKILETARSRFLFQVKPLHSPIDKIVSDDRLVGLKFVENRWENGAITPVPDSEKEVKAPLVIASIGSLPESIPGIPMQYHVYDLGDENCCRIKGYPHVFAIGNAVTGRGNINESLKHSQEVTLKIVDQLIESDEKRFEDTLQRAELSAKDKISNFIEYIAEFPAPSETQWRRIEKMVADFHLKNAYTGSYQDWIAKNRPVRLEDMTE
ncbi:MAG TPA: FAD-dependent oxidoreductase [Saprospiraceae bacterium]|nr:FAD-dependent oxidoreductase [Saprospiraceae bacterium]HMQ82735.1 FAD-dependent oxidoreductase [Saprospiraceae bacterium]